VKYIPVGALAASLLTLGFAAAASAQPAADYRDRLPADEIIYFLLPDRFENGDTSNDRGGLSGGRLATGYDPTAKGFYHGGDLRGVMRRLDYVQSLGATAIWLAPVFKNKPVQGSPGHESAGYHGYWITDFTRVDAHFGSNEDMRALIGAAHARGLKVYLDIVVNHTADVIAYRECPHACPYRSRADFPYQRHGGIGGEPINAGFLGDAAENQTPENFAHLTRPDYAYTPVIPRGDEHLKVPDWLNDPIYYHNRGESTFSGESSTMGDFVGLDDLMTENPRVVQGFIDIYGAWIDQFRVDGFRIDTARHVNREFLQAFVPAMLERAAAQGIPNFHVFGEVSISSVEPGLLAVHTRDDELPAVLDFAFAVAVRSATMGVSGTDVLARLYAGDALYAGGEAAALRLPTFISNHDQGRYGYFLHKALPGITETEALKRESLAYAMLLTLRGVPVIYYGDEQGFAGAGDDMDARQDMFASRVASFNAGRMIGDASATGANLTVDHFNSAHPLYREIRELAQLRQLQSALRRGRQIVRSYSDAPGLFAVSRIEPGTGREVLIAFNTSAAPLRSLVEVAVPSIKFESLHGHCDSAVSAPGSYRVELAPLDFVICKAVQR
jgi:glycosidase